MQCLLICFLLSHSSLPLMHQHLSQSILLGDTGICFVSPAPGGTRHGGQGRPMCHCDHVLIDTQPGRVELQGGQCCRVQFCHLAQVKRAVRTAGEALSHCLLPLYCSCQESAHSLFPPSSPFFLIPGPRHPNDPGSMLAMAGLRNGGHTCE
jgi:hypothetical protein